MVQYILKEKLFSNDHIEVEDLNNVQKLDLIFELKNFRADATELSQLCILINKFKNNGLRIPAFDKFYMGFKIEKSILGDYDFLKINTDNIVSIEFKDISKAKDEEEKKEILDKLKKQMEIRLETLNVFNREIIAIGLIQNNNEQDYYKLENDKLKKITDNELINILTNSVTDYTVDDLSDYLCFKNLLESPLTLGKFFLRNKYSLTDGQYACIKNIMKLDKKFYTIEGRAGTGKSIVGFELARRFAEESKKVAYFFMGSNKDIYSEFEGFDFNVFSLESYKSKSRGEIKNRFEKIYTEEFDILIIDESQRLTEIQINRIKKLILQDKKNSRCIFLLDKDQNMDSLATGEKIVNKIKELSEANLKLKMPLRFDLNMEYFIRLLFKKRLMEGDPSKANVDVIRLSSNDVAIEYVNFLRKKQNFTPLVSLHSIIGKSYQISTAKNGFVVIGQEFDNVVIILDHQFNYSDECGLELNEFCRYQGSCNIIQLYYEIITRVKNKLKILVVNNDELYYKLVDLKKYNSDKK